jgi:hypothetical protein
MTTALRMPAMWDKEEINRWLHYHGEATKEMSKLRTSLESKLIPISAYILISAVECYRRHPEMLLTIDAAMPAEEIGAAGRVPGNQVDSVHIWSQANIFLHGRHILTLLGKITGDHEPERTAIVLDFWRRAAKGFRGDEHLQAIDAGFRCTPHTDHVLAALVDGSHPVKAERWSDVKKMNATLTSYLFLLYFDTRSGMVDTGPYDLGDGRVLLVRDFSKMGASDFWWSSEIAAGLPYDNRELSRPRQKLRIVHHRQQHARTCGAGRGRRDPRGDQASTVTLVPRHREDDAPRAHRRRRLRVLHLPATVRRGRRCRRQPRLDRPTRLPRRLRHARRIRGD